MSFLQPWLLAGLPLVALPIVIHLINQRRFQTVHWGAMMFLLAARRMSRGYSRIRQWLILLFRTLAVAGLVLAVSRPLASGWVGLAAGGKADTTIVLLDRSPSMQQRDSATGDSKLDAARSQLVQTFKTLGSDRWVVIDSATRSPHELESPDMLLSLPSAGPSSAAADLPLMLEAALDYIRDNRTGYTEIWICSDLRANDWSPESGRWQSLRDAFSEMPQSVRIHLLAYPQAAANNLSVRVTEVHRRTARDGSELLVSFDLLKIGGDEKVSVPVQFEIQGTRSVLNVELTGAETHYTDHRIPLKRDHQRGWGRISIPTDGQPADDAFYFVFDDPPPRRTLIVAAEREVERPLRLAAAISPDPAFSVTAEAASVDALSSVEWNQIALVVWQEPLPEGESAESLKSFVKRGGRIIFLPPPNPDATSLFGARWASWMNPETALSVQNWRNDEDLLARTQNGDALPVGQLKIHRHCTLAGEFTNLATLSGGAPLLVRAAGFPGGAYFLATSPAPRDSSLAADGVVFYALVQRALAAGAAMLGQARQLDAGEPAGEDTASWQRLDGADDVLSTEFAVHGGTYSSGDVLLAVNRPLAEDNTKLVADQRIAELFRGLDFVRVDGQMGGPGGLVEEIWRLFLMVMLSALLVEAVLCLPKWPHRAGSSP